MIRVEITSESAAVLRETLENDLSDLRMEIASTDSQTFRQMLKERKLALLEVLAALPVPNDRAQTRAAQATDATR